MLVGLNAGGEIVSARILNCVDDTGAAIGCSFAGGSGPMQAGGDGGFSLFTSASAFTSGTGLGPLDLPSPFGGMNDPTKKALSVLLIVVLVVSAFVVTRR